MIKRRLLTLIAVSLVVLYFFPRSGQRVHKSPFSSQCSLVPPRVLENLHKVPDHELHVYLDGDELSKNDVVQAPQRVCLIAAMAQHRLPDEWYPDEPVAGKGPDTIHLLIKSENVTQTFPPLLPLPNQREATLQFSERAVLYFAEPYFLTEGTFQIHAEQEWGNWLWAQEWGWNEATQKVEYVTGPHEGIEIAQDHPWKNRTIEWDHKFPASIRVSEPDKGWRERLPLCDDMNTAAEGQWYYKPAFPDIPDGMVDEWGWSWQGHNCRLDFYEPIDIFDCLENKVVHSYGASNARRLGKMIVTGGQYCTDPSERCQAEDDYEGADVYRMRVNPDDNQMIFESTELTFQFKAWMNTDMEFGKNSHLFFTFISSITNSTSIWMDPLYNQEDLIIATSDLPGDPPQDRLVKDGAKARQPPEKLKADLLIVNTGCWDSAFTNRFQAFEEWLPQYRDSLLEAYEDTPMVVHLSPTFCCRLQDSFSRRYTGTRLQSFDDVSRRTFRVPSLGSTGKGLDGRVSVLDPQHMGGRPEVIWDWGPSKANHFRANHVRTEMQMLANTICRRDEHTRKAEFRFNDPRYSQRSHGNPHLNYHLNNHKQAHVPQEN